MSISFLDNGLRIRFSGKTDIGRVRDHNEDDVLLPSEIPIAAVSDGMGGHACGEVASHLAVETVDNYYTRTVAESPPNWPFRMPQLQIERDRMTSAIKLANTRIHETGLGDPSKKGMGCTIDAIYFSQGRCYIGHVGDSRVYKIRGVFEAGMRPDATYGPSLFRIRNARVEEAVGAKIFKVGETPAR